MSNVATNLVDKRAYLNVLGALMQDPLLIDDVDKPLDRTDFDTEKFYELLYVAIYNLYQQGVEIIDEMAIDSYLSKYPEQYTIFQANNGLTWVADAKSMSELGNYDYYYHRVRKYSLLRYYEKNGLDTRFIYDYTEQVRPEQENQKFNNYTEEDIVQIVEERFIVSPNIQYCSNNMMDVEMAGDGLDEMIEEYMDEPDVGLPLSSPILTTLTRGSRMGCLYMRASIQGGGKTRFAVMDACKVAVPYYWDIQKKEWVHTGISEPVVYIVAEQNNKEIKSIILACVSGVDEEHIKYGMYDEGELERVRQASIYIKQSPLIQCHIPDFSIDDIKNIVKKYHREKNVMHFYFDYIFSSMKVMQNMNSKVGTGAGLKEHQFLLLFSTELKTLCQTLGVFMLTACQLNGEVVNATIKDNNILAGAKSLANKLDAGWNTLPPSAAEMKKIEPILHKMIGVPKPNMVTWVYKIRAAKITRVMVWSYYDLGSLRCRDLFVTNYNYELIDVDMTKIEVAEKVIQENSVSERDVLKEQMEQEKIEEKVQTNNIKFDW